MAGFVNAPEHTSLFRLAAAIPLVYAFYTVFVGTANGQRRFHVQASFDVGFSITKTVLLLAGAAVGHMAGHSVAGAFAGFIAAAVVIMLVAARKMWLHPGQGRFSPARLLVFMGGAVTYTGLINLALSYDSLLLRRFAGAALAGQGSKADALVGVYEAVRSLALLPYQALLVVTFVIFPLVSRSTFAEDREATRAYVRQTLRYALIIGAAMAVVLGARPATLLRIFYPAGYGTGAAALPILAAGVVALALLSIAGSIVTASGRPYVAVALVAVTLAAGTGLAFTLVPRAVAGPAMLSAAAVSTAAGMLVGFLAALGYLWRRFGAGLPLLSVLRVLLATALAVGAARLVPGAGIVAGAAAMALAGLVFAWRCWRRANSAPPIARSSSRSSAPEARAVGATCGRPVRSERRIKMGDRSRCESSRTQSCRKPASTDSPRPRGLIRRIVVKPSAGPHAPRGRRCELLRAG